MDDDINGKLYDFVDSNNYFCFFHTEALIILGIFSTLIYADSGK